MTRFRALLIVLCTTVAVLVPASPAHAGWSGARCYEEPSNDIAVCAQVYTTYISSQNRYRVERLHLCAWHNGDTGSNPFLNTYSGSVQYRGSNGANQGYALLKDTNTGSCTISEHVFVMGAQACYTAQGNANLNIISDRPWTVRGSILGGPC